jgi:hypothetical protein
LLTRDEDLIKKQITDAEELIEREVDEFYTRHPKEGCRDSSAESKTNGTSKETVGEPQLESPSVPNVDTTNISLVQAPQSEESRLRNRLRRSIMVRLCLRMRRILSSIDLDMELVFLYE